MLSANQTSQVMTPGYSVQDLINFSQVIGQHCPTTHAPEMEVFLNCVKKDFLEFIDTVFQPNDTPQKVFYTSKQFLYMRLSFLFKLAFFQLSMPNQVVIMPLILADIGNDGKYLKLLVTEEIRLSFLGNIQFMLNHPTKLYFTNPNILLQIQFINTSLMQRLAAEPENIFFRIENGKYIEASLMINIFIGNKKLGDQNHSDDIYRALANAYYMRSIVVSEQGKLHEAVNASKETLIEMNKITNKTVTDAALITQYNLNYIGSINDLAVETHLKIPTINPVDIFDQAIAEAHALGITGNYLLIQKIRENKLYTAVAYARRLLAKKDYMQCITICFNTIPLIFGMNLLNPNERLKELRTTLSNALKDSKFYYSTGDFSKDIISYHNLLKLYRIHSQSLTAIDNEVVNHIKAKIKSIFANNLFSTTPESRAELTTCIKEALIYENSDTDLRDSYYRILILLHLHSVTAMTSTQFRIALRELNEATDLYLKITVPNLHNQHNLFGRIKESYLSVLSTMNELSMEYFILDDIGLLENTMAWLKAILCTEDAKFKTEILQWKIKKLAILEASLTQFINAKNNQPFSIFNLSPEVRTITLFLMACPKTQTSYSTSQAKITELIQHSPNHVDRPFLNMLYERVTVLADLHCELTVSKMQARVEHRKR